MKIKNMIILVLLLGLYISCSDDKNPVSSEDGSTNARELSMKEIQLPDALKQSTDNHAFSAQLNVNSVNAFSNLSFYFTPPDDAEALSKNSSANDWTKNWDLGNGLSIKMDYYETDTKFGWTVYLNGSNGVDNFNNMKYIEAEEIISSSQGNLKFYTPGTNDLGIEWMYSSINGVYNVTYLTYSNGVGYEKYIVSSNPDLSGSINRYQIDGNNETIKSNITWTSAGTGTWIDYDSEGNELNNGTF